MPEPLSLSPPLRITAACLLLVALGGCAQVNDWLRGNRDEAANSDVIPGAPLASEYIDDMYRIASGDPATQAEIYADSQAAATLTPDPSTRLRLALILATPGHAESDPEKAQDMLRELLSQSELLSSGEISLATIQLYNVEQRLMLGRETERLQKLNSQNASTEQRATERRVAAVEAENRKLRESLAEAEQKLEAITTIERSIRELTENGNNQ